jgi:hypothetical protein
VTSRPRSCCRTRSACFRRASRWSSSGSPPQPDGRSRRSRPSSTSRPAPSATATVGWSGLALTLRPTPHRFTVDGRTLYAWCATDTLVFPVILGKPGVVESTCPQTGQPIRIELTPDAVERLDPPAAVMSALRPIGKLADMRAATCNHGHFFSSAAASANWVRQHPDGYVYPVEEAFRLDRGVITRLGWEAHR